MERAWQLAVLAFLMSGELSAGSHSLPDDSDFLKSGHESSFVAESTEDSTGSMGDGNEMEEVIVDDEANSHATTIDDEHNNRRFDPEHPRSGGKGKIVTKKKIFERSGASKRKSHVHMAKPSGKKHFFRVKRNGKKLDQSVTRQKHVSRYGHNYGWHTYAAANNKQNDYNSIQHKKHVEAHRNTKRKARKFKHGGASNDVRGRRQKWIFMRRPRQLAEMQSSSGLEAKERRKIDAFERKEEQKIDAFARNEMSILDRARKNRDGDKEQDYAAEEAGLAQDEEDEDADDEDDESGDADTDDAVEIEEENWGEDEEANDEDERADAEEEGKKDVSADDADEDGNDYVSLLHENVAEGI
eukprot:TRINITY_DN70923_c0_g1_i1.p1 TRINITY_DN70923_c0_g1~~TRINITY_DN70923_c0_g1_i1.p1  ORF type:complete len:379 (+),score=75.58 TRINITY_DN70923_c0_g1_i1:71-1138(+)